MIPITGVLVASAVVTLFLGILRYAQQAQELDARYEEMTAQMSEPEEEAVQAHGLKDKVDGWLGTASFARHARARLVSANVKLTVTEYMLLRVGVTLVAFLAGWAISHLLVGGILVGIRASSLPNAYVSRLQSKRLQAFQDQLPDVLGMLVNSLRAGHGLLQAVNLVTKEMPPPTSEEFDRVRREVNLGLPMSEALAHMTERIESDDLGLMVTAINVQHEVGGNLAEILDSISGTIRERVRILGEVRTLTAQQRLVGTVLAGLPFLLGTVLMMINPEYMKGLFEPGLPLMLASGAVVMVVMGYVLMQKMLAVDV
jgi:tight adherence protein B